MTDSEYETARRGIVRQFFGEDVRRMSRGLQPNRPVKTEIGKRDGRGRAVPMNEEELPETPTI